MTMEVCDIKIFF